MCEACFCGWCGELEDKVLVYSESNGGALACPWCGRVDPLAWLSPAQRSALLKSVQERHVLAQVAVGVAA
jgi:hypothetical protein